MLLFKEEDFPDFLTMFDLGLLLITHSISGVERG